MSLAALREFAAELLRGVCVDFAGPLAGAAEDAETLE